MTRDEFLNLNDSNVKEVFVEEWNRPVHIRRIPNIDTDAMAKTQDDKRPLSQLVWPVLYGMCDQGGKPLFTPKDYDLVAAKNNLALAEVAKAVIEYNRPRIEDKKKDSEPTTD